VHLLHVGLRDGAHRDFLPFWSEASSQLGTFECVDLDPKISFRELQDILRWHLKKASVDLLILHWDDGIAAAIWATTGSRTRVVVHRYAAEVLDPTTVKRVASARVASFVVPTEGASLLVEAAGVRKERVHEMWMVPKCADTECADVIGVYAPTGRSKVGRSLKAHMHRYGGPEVRIMQNFPVPTKVVIDVQDREAPSAAIAEAVQRGAVVLVRDTPLNRVVYKDQVLYYTDTSLPEMSLRALAVEGSSSPRTDPVELSKLYQEASL